MKPVVWVGSAKADLKAFPEPVFDDMGHQLFRVQCGLEPDDWKPMSSVGTGVREIRIRDSTGAFRTIYLATRPEAVYACAAFGRPARRRTSATSILQDGD
jgi:phage-related protein